MKIGEEEIIEMEDKQLNDSDVPSSKNEVEKVHIGKIDFLMSGILEQNQTIRFNKEVIVLLIRVTNIIHLWPILSLSVVDWNFQTNVS